MSRGPDGRYGYRAPENPRDPVPVTCGRCYSTTTGPIWRGTITVPSGEMLYGVPLNDYVPGTLCASCCQSEQTYGTRSCRWCRRQVSYGGVWSQPRRYCGRRCEIADRTARRRAERELARQRKCAHCGSAFDAPRQDAAYCAPACRQAAYRKRLAEQAAQRAYDAEMLRQWDELVRS
jgi:hypothetical protein